tara:strand:+ start:2363 stop:4423 length:2061 start_codon:yes stop_codon:yes gene_type:complete
MQAKRFFLLIFFSFFLYSQESKSENQETDTDFITSNVGLPSVDVNSNSFMITRTEVPWDIQTDKAFVNSNLDSQSKRVALFGDTHVHTTYSFDAYSFGTTATPDDAYRFAKGGIVIHPAGFETKLKKPLDFYVVTDHGLFLGIVREAATEGTRLYENYSSESVRDLNIPENLNLNTLEKRSGTFLGYVFAANAAVMQGNLDPNYLVQISRDAWKDIIGAADRHNNPGTFTTFVGYEYTSSTDAMDNLHRNVIFRGDGNRYPELPFSRMNSLDPEDLWDWMDSLRAQGIESMAIPHNSNGSGAQMFKLKDFDGNEFDSEYVAKRLRNEPIVEITQIKGTSDTHPALSKNDEWADFEIMPWKVATMEISKVEGGSYVREALLNGLKLELEGKGNPFKFGFIGSTDGHTAASSLDEENYFAKVGLLDSTPELRGSIPITTQALLERGDSPITGGSFQKDIDGKKYVNASSISYGASGLAAVWAEENTRESIYSALRRKEAFATSGPRIKVRFFVGYDFNNEMINDEKLIQHLYEKGHSMGSDILNTIKKSEPEFFVWAVQDADSAPLQRLQVIKGYVEDGEIKEIVFDVACSDGLDVNPDNYRCPDNGAQVNLDDCSYDSSTGSSELKTFWKDPTYIKGQRVFYYVRVLENPTCRWSTWDALRNNVEPRSDYPKTIQERAWSSPIHLLP